MAAKNERVAEMVRREMAKNPNIGNDVLMKQARAIDPKLRRLNPRQFHATYRLPATRAAKQAARASAPAAAPAAAPAPRAAEAPQEPRRAPEPKAAPEKKTASAAPATSRAAARALSSAAERDAVREILHGIVRDSLRADDRASFLEILESLDGRASMILAIFGRK